MTVEYVYDIIEAGLRLMLKSARDEGRAFWNSGDENDRRDLMDWMRTSALPVGHPEHRVQPHLSRNYEEGFRRIQKQADILSGKANYERFPARE